MSLQLSWFSNEILTPETTLYIRSSRSLSADSAQYGVKFWNDQKELEGRIIVLEKTIQISTAGLSPGRYNVTINSLQDSQREVINKYPIRASLRLTEMRGKVSTNLSILHVVYLAVGDLHTTKLNPGETSPDGTFYLEMAKVSPREIPSTSVMSFDVDGNVVDGERLLADVAIRRHAKFGVVEERLWYLLETAEKEELFDITVWPSEDRDVKEENMESMDSDELLDDCSNPQSTAFERPKAEIKKVLKSWSAVCLEEATIPPIMTKLSKIQILKLSKLKDISKVFLNDTQPQSCSLSTALAISKVNTAHIIGSKGKGVNVAIWDRGPWETTGVHFETERFGPDGPVPSQRDDYIHMRCVAGIIKNDKDEGFAPECTLWAANSNKSTDTMAVLTWAQSKRCRVINQSFIMTSDGNPYGSPDVTSTDLLVDWMALQRPFPMFVRAAGKQEKGQPPAYVGSKSYNGLIVGSHDLMGAKMDETSVYKNPGSVAHHDRELPDICAPGKDINVLGFKVSGTSFAAPAVAGLVATLYSTIPANRGYTEGYRSIIYAAAGRRVSEFAGKTWWESVSQGAASDLHDGAGMLDGEAVVKIARNCAVDRGNRVYNASGWANDYLDPVKDFRNGTANSRSGHGYFVKSPKTDGPIRIRAALAWEVKVKPTNGAPVLTPLTNFDLRVVDKKTGKPAGASTSFDNNYEIVEWDAYPQHTYEIFFVQPVAQGTDVIMVGLAWGMFTNATEGQSI